MYRFVIGREKPGQVSEVAQLISQTLEQERRQRELLEQHYAQYDADDDEVTDCLAFHCSVFFNILFSILNSFFLIVIQRSASGPLHCLCCWFLQILMMNLIWRIKLLKAFQHGFKVFVLFQKSKYQIGRCFSNRCSSSEGIYFSEIGIKLVCLSTETLVFCENW